MFLNKKNKHETASILDKTLCKENRSVLGIFAFRMS